MGYKDWWQPLRWERLPILLRRTELWFVLVLLAILALVWWLLGAEIIYLLEWAETSRTILVTLGPLAPLAYIALFAMQILIAPFPGQFMAIMSGYLFGIFWGALYSILGLTLGAGLAMGLARWYGRPLLERFFEPASIHQWERKLRMRSPITWGLLFLFPVPDLVFYAAGLSRVPMRQLLLAVITGRGLGLFLASIFGSLSATLPPEWVIGKWILLLFVALAGYRYQRHLRLFVLLSVRRIQRFTRRWWGHLQLLSHPNRSNP
jgi:uncharacterized membrane protein YdjX (TVP38/TMEM64 family)